MVDCILGVIYFPDVAEIQKTQTPHAAGNHWTQKSRERWGLSVRS